jgi:hypothetical protein
LDEFGLVENVIRPELPLLALETTILRKRLYAGLALLLLDDGSPYVIAELFSHGLGKEFRLFSGRRSKMDRPIEIGFSKRGRRKAPGDARGRRMHRLIDGMTEPHKLAVVRGDARSAKRSPGLTAERCGGVDRKATTSDGCGPKRGFA